MAAWNACAAEGLEKQVPHAARFYASGKDPFGCAQDKRDDSVEAHKLRACGIQNMNNEKQKAAELGKDGQALRYKKMAAKRDAFRRRRL